MLTPLQRQLRRDLEAVLRGEMPFADFWGDVMALRRTGTDHEETRLLYQVVGRLYEYEDGHLTDDELHAALTGVLEDVRALPGAEPSPRTSSEMAERKS